MEKFRNVPTPGMLQGEALVLLNELNAGRDDCKVVSEARIGNALVKLTLRKEGDRCVATAECAGKEPRPISCPLSFEDATEEDEETFDIACLWRNISNS